jgi:proton glutamate symport protein
MSFTWRVLIGLAAGFALGSATAASHWFLLIRLSAAIEPIGIIWVNAIRLAVIPLVVASLVVAVGQSGDTRRIGQLGARALVLLLVTLTIAVVLALAIGLPALRWIHSDPRMLQSISAAPVHPPSASQWFIDLVPVNVVKAAADGALLPMIVFAIGFGLALTRVEAQSRAAVLGFFRGVYEAFLVIIRFVIALAPVGVFALAVPLAQRVGWTAAGSLAIFVVIVSATCALSIVLLHLSAAWFGGVPLRVFSAACAPAQSITFSSRSSLAALPAAYEGAREVMKLPEDVCDLFIPLGVSMFRVGGAIAIAIGVLFLSRLYGMPLNPAAVATVAVASIAASLTVPGVPGGSILVMAPVLTAVGVPADGIGILLAVDAIPDMFRTTANVTGTMAVAAFLARMEHRGGEEQSAVQRQAFGGK